MNIEIYGYRSELKFNFKTFRILAEMWGLKGVQAVFNEFADMEGREMDVFVDLIAASIKAKGNDVITVDDVGDWLLKNTDKIGELTVLLTDILPQPNPEEVESGGKSIPTPEPVPKN